uniref:Uncharacterized protein n=1 Tax=Glaucocystis incrassata TaxID=1789788 RepID=A0A3G1IVE6_9EUKA|nr:hypothetical protein [Glaucocystis incrassata]ASQ40013.1 hypothetical protein [Glaucocystis incrassata]
MLRLPILTNELTDSDIQEIRRRINDNPQLQYIYGNLRANYISQDKKTRAIVFSRSQEEVINFLQQCFYFINVPFDVTCLSFTSHRERINLRKRTMPICKTPLNPDSYKPEFPLRLYRAGLLVNGLAQPIILYRALD